LCGFWWEPAEDFFSVSAPRDKNTGGRVRIPATLVRR
jgi:hypothetical protein